ncbi:MAG: ATP-binding protein [Methanobrevibacter sp.]|nr:ATP-binding protein [Candidatus Methanovirga aequatorialis]
MRDLPLGINTFEIIRNNDYLYVDKTKYIYQMFKPGQKYFLSRPRRFGKSLLVSTMENLFNGKKELFEGLYIYDKWDWDKRNPVIKLDFSEGDFATLKKLEVSLNDTLEDVAEDYDIELKRESVPNKFGELIKKLNKKYDKKVVVLVDEYDIPIIQNLYKFDLLDDIQNTLKSFYNVLKRRDAYIEFLFITGVSKFANLSLFSTLNNPDDLTFEDDFACICGYTHEELLFYFEDYIKQLQLKENLSYDDLVDKIVHWYDGYSWNGNDKVYSPYSTLKLFKSKKFKNYWIKTATSKSLIDVFRNSDDYTEILNPIIVNESRFDDFNYEDIDPVSFALQTGYLTIVNEEVFNDIIHYKLEMPNFEVERSLFDYLLDLNVDLNDFSKIRPAIIRSIKSLDNNTFQEQMKGFLAKVPSRIHLDYEFYYQSIFISWLMALGFKVNGEDSTNKGNIGMILEEKDFVVVGECKFSKMKYKSKINEPVKSFEKMICEAVNQINEKKYYEKYSNKKLYYVAFAFAGKEVETKIFEKQG